jgi:hypothetical protein
MHYLCTDDGSGSRRNPIVAEDEDTPISDPSKNSYLLSRKGLKVES